MSIFSWFTAKKKKVEKHVPPPSSGLSRIDSTKPYVGERPNGPAVPPGQPANRKHERMARRELLYTVVREAMVRAGVLSSSYKFKVLSLDPRGRQFLVMVDLSQGAGSDTTRLAEVEALIAQAAKSRHDILVSAVYWRSIEHVAVGDPVVRTVARSGSNSRPTPLSPLGTDSQPVPLLETVSQPAELMVPLPEPRSEARNSGPGRFDPLGDDEVAAFQRALSAGLTPKEAAARTAPRPGTPEHDAFARTQVLPRREDAALKPKPVPPAAKPEPVLAGAAARDFDGSNKHGPQSYTLLTGFEDTEMPGEEGNNLSATQYGELR